MPILDLLDIEARSHRSPLVDINQILRHVGPKVNCVVLVFVTF